MSTSYLNLIGGEWTAGTPKPNLNPSDLSDVVGDYHHASTAQARVAVEAARAAFPAWSHSGIQARADMLDRVGAEILARRAELGDLLAREEGKTLPEATGEVTRAGNIFKFFAGEALRIPGEKFASVRAGFEVEVTREPVGVVTLITPWNFPIAIPAWKTAPALAFGNCVLLKPAEAVPGCAWALADIIHRAGFPAGVFNLVMGKGSELGPTLTGAGVDAVSFTGSLQIGQHLLAEASKRQIRVQLEMGGKNPLLVLDDADLDIAVRVALDGSYFATGQRCTASSRLIVQKGIHDRFIGALTTALKNQVVDDARRPGTTIGPVVDQRQLEQDLRYIEQARTQGARLHYGGERLVRPKDGFYLSPALFTETTSGMTLNREEVFGPVAGVIAVDSYDEGLAIANDTPFGICAGLCTSSMKHASHFKRASQAGMVMINLPTAGVDYHVPFGGRKGSSYGPREQGQYAVEFYTSVKTTYINPG
jgi:aldehyde dehydrogenase (NAD+)